MSPSSSVSASPSDLIVGVAEDIITIQQADNLTIIKTTGDDIIIKKPIDEVTILDIENALSGNAALADSITIIKQKDDISVAKQQLIDIIVKD